ncbi:MAG: ribbon-helix-helix protein, CopG family [Thaumarchaeota archaeon]|nr:ribbon-helix-helix protein, CopG family [Nitrososphaerota archaeon]
MGTKMLLNLPEKDLKRIETLVKAGEYTTKSEFIRFAVKQLLYSQERVKTLEEMTSRLQRQTKSRKDVEREIEDAKEGTRRLISKMGEHH